MILDYNNHILHYSSIHPQLKKAFEFALGLADCAVGRYEQNNYYAMVQQGLTTPVTDGDLEAHKAYIDVQIVVSGLEIVEWEDISRLSVSIPYDANRDISFYSGHGQYFSVHHDMFYIMFPQDGHKPLKCLYAPTNYKKIVLKLPISNI